MKKFFSLFFILSTVFFFSKSLLAETISDSRFSFKLYDTSTDVSTTTINWDKTKIKPGEDKWVWSTTYAKVRTENVPSNVVYYIYQDNIKGSIYTATNFRTEEDGGKIYHRYNGLVNKDTQGGEDKGFLPLNYVLVSSKLDSSNFEKDYNPEISIGGDVAPDGLDRSARYFMDKSDVYMKGEEEVSNFTENKGYCAIADGSTASDDHGPVFWYFDNEWTQQYVRWTSNRLTDNTGYMYFGANFKNASKGTVFGTDKIIIEQVTE